MSGEKQIRVVIADEHRLFREGLSLIFSQGEDIEVVGEAANGRQAVDVVSELEPDLILLNITMPDTASTDVISPIRQHSPNTKVLVIASSRDEAMIFEALKAGAKGYISNDTRASDLIKAIQVVHQGELWVERKMMAKFFDGEALADLTEEGREARLKQPLTPKEKEVLSLLTTGYTNKEIAQALFISEKTVKSHLNSIFRKLNVTRRLQAILYAIEKGMG
jgi:DNA-binding NarL/FixJ family response regulator